MSDQSTPSVYKHFTYARQAGALGAEIIGVQLNGQLDAAVLNELQQALVDFKVLFFRDQQMTQQDHVDFAHLVGTPVDADFLPALEGYPMMTQQQYDENNRMGSDISFHHDDSFHKYPTKMSILRSLEVPDHGGDTIWANTEAVYDSLSEPLQLMLEELTAEHSLAYSFGADVLRYSGGARYDKMMQRNPPHVHPVVIRHPDTGRKSVYVSELLTSRINELSEAESALLLHYIAEQAYRPEFACRFHWEANSVAWWDNRCTVHRGIDDFYPALRVMQRVAIADEQQPSQCPADEPRRDFSGVAVVPCNSLDEMDNNAISSVS